MGRGATDPNGTAAEALAAGISRRTAQRRRKALLSDGESIELVPAGQGFAFPVKRRVEPREAAAEASSIQGAIVARLREAIEAGDAPAIKVYTSAWVDACKCLKVLEDWAVGLDRADRRREESVQIEKEMKALGLVFP